MLREREPNAREFDAIVLLDLERQGVDPLDPALRDEMAERLVQLFELVVGRRVAEPDHEQIAGVAQAVVVGVEAVDLANGVVAGVGDEVELGVGRGDESTSNELAVDETCDPFPVRVARSVEQHDRNRNALACLGQRQQFERLVERAESTRQRDERTALLDQHQLAGEEVLHADILGVTGDDRVRALLEREPDRYADALFAPGALHRSLHDPRACAGDDHPVLVGEPLGHQARLDVQRVVGLGPRRAEDRNLATTPKRGEHRVGLAHLDHRRRRDLEVEGRRAVGDHRCRGPQQFLGVATIVRRVEHVEQVLDGGRDCGAQRKGHNSTVGLPGKTFRNLRMSA